MDIALQIAVSIACVLVLAECALFARNLSRLRSLAAQDPPPVAEWPRVSVVMAARDEAADVGSAVASRLADDYPELEVLLVDDRSSDGTGDAARAAAGDDPRFRVVRVDELPPGWLGKVHALERGLAEASGEWLLFSDADVVVEPGTLKRAVAYCLAERLDMLALVPAYATGSFLVDALWAGFMRMLAVLMDPDAVRNPAKKAAIGSGAFNLVSREALARTPGFEHIRMETGDDAALGLMIKQADGRIEMISGRGCATVAVYRSVRAFMRGIEKNGSTMAARPFVVTLLGMALYLSVEYAPLTALALYVAGGPVWLGVLGGGALALTTAVYCTALWTNTRTWAAGLAWPVGLALLACGMLRSTWLAHRHGGVYWRDTFYPLGELHAGRRFTI